MTLKFMGIDLSSQTGFDMARKQAVNHIEGYKTHGPDPEFKRYASQLGDDVENYANELLGSYEAMQKSGKELKISPKSLQTLRNGEEIWVTAMATDPVRAAFWVSNVKKGRMFSGMEGVSKAQNVILKTGFKTPDAPHEEMTFELGL